MYSIIKCSINFVASLLNIPCLLHFIAFICLYIDSLSIYKGDLRASTFQIFRNEREKVTSLLEINVCWYISEWSEICGSVKFSGFPLKQKKKWNCFSVSTLKSLFEGQYSKKFYFLNLFFSMYVWLSFKLFNFY